MQKIKQMEEICRGLDLQSSLRQRRQSDPVTAAVQRVDGREYMLLSSNNYLGLTHHPEVIAAAAAAAERYGTGSGGARLTSGNHPLYSSLERNLAEFKQAEDALIFGTGYMANIGTVSALADREQDCIFSDALNHASLIDGCRLAKAKTVVYPHANMSRLQQLLQQTPCSGQRFILTDGVFSMDGDIAPLEEIVYLALKYDCLVIVDDAHATGVIGPAGRGTSAYYGLKGRVAVELGTLSKSLAAEGGFVSGSKVLITYLVNRARSFIFSTALSAPVVAAGAAALSVLRQEPERVSQLQRKAELVKKILLQGGVQLLSSDTPILPILSGSAERALAFSKRLEQRGLLVSAIRPPTVPVGQSRLRLTVTDAHSEADLRRAAQIVIEEQKDL